MRVLLNWVDGDPARNFVVTKKGAAHETRWRVAVWVNPEGEMYVSKVGEGFGETLYDASHMAIENWKNQDEMVPPGGYEPGHWYVTIVACRPQRTG